MLKVTWGDFAQFFKVLMQEKVTRFGKPVIITAHVKAQREGYEILLSLINPLSRILALHMDYAENYTHICS